MQNQSCSTIPAVSPQVFLFDSSEVRTLLIDGEPWFVAKDVAETLGYARPKDAVAAHCKGAAKHRLLTNGGNQDVTIIPERDVYRLVMRSKLPSAEKFEEWVVGEVLPSLRKTGTYSVAPAPLSPEIQIAQAMLLAGKMIEEQKVQIEHQAKLIADIQPKAAIADQLVLCEGSVNLTTAAKLLNFPPHKFIKELQQRQWIYKRPGSTRWTAFQPKINAGYIEHKEYIKLMENGDSRAFPQPMITQRGLARLTTLLNAQLELEVAA